MLSARPFQKAVVRRSGRNPHIIIFHKIVPAQSPRPRRQELRYRQRCLPEKMARDESAIRLRGTGLHWAEASRRRMKSSAETLSYSYPVWPQKLYANVQLWQSKFCVQRVDERERRFAVSCRGPPEKALRCFPLTGLYGSTAEKPPGGRFFWIVRIGS